MNNENLAAYAQWSMPECHWLVKVYDSGISRYFHLCIRYSNDREETLTNAENQFWNHGLKIVRNLGKMVDEYEKTPTHIHFPMKLIFEQRTNDLFIMATEKEFTNGYAVEGAV